MQVFPRLTAGGEIKYMKILVGALLTAMLAVPLFAQKDVDARLKAATEDLRAMTNASDNDIPMDLLNKARCTAGRAAVGSPRGC